MNKGKILKSVEAAENDLELINQYTRRQMNADEVYCFSLILCDNEIDRDFEQFPTQELYKLAELFVGKTGIFDHQPSAKNQCARIYRCRVETDELKKNSAGEAYACVIADAYIPRIDANTALIEEIESGIKKEVSIGCSVKSTICSICGNDMGYIDCVHKKGQLYQDKLCYGKLSEVVDAYEWSFVAVPAQRQAGVIKNKMFGGVLLEKALEKLKAAGSVTLSEADKTAISSYIEKLKGLCSDGEKYRLELKNDILKLNALTDSEIPSTVLSSIADRMTISELKAFKSTFTKKQAQPQLYTNTEKDKINRCDEYSI